MNLRLRFLFVGLTVFVAILAFGLTAQRASAQWNTCFGQGAWSIVFGCGSPQNTPPPHGTAGCTQSRIWPVLEGNVNGRYVLYNGGIDRLWLTGDPLQLSGIVSQQSNDYVLLPSGAQLNGNRFEDPTTGDYLAFSTGGGAYATLSDGRVLPCPGLTSDTSAGSRLIFGSLTVSPSQIDFYRTDQATQRTGWPYFPTVRKIVTLSQQICYQHAPGMQQSDPLPPCGTATAQFPLVLQPTQPDHPTPVWWKALHPETPDTGLYAPGQTITPPPAQPTLDQAVIDATATTLVRRSGAQQPQQQFTGRCLDQAGNELSGASKQWSANQGESTQTGFYTAPATGDSDRLTLTCTSQGISRMGVALLTILDEEEPPPPEAMLDRAEIDIPSITLIRQSATQQPQQQFTGRCLDQAGNELSGASKQWSANQGESTQTGFYTAPASGDTDRLTFLCLSGDERREAFAAIELGLPNPTIEPPTDAPTLQALEACTEDQTEVVLSWTEVPNATDYVLFRDSTELARFSWANGTMATTYVDQDMVDGQTYQYMIRASNAAGGRDSQTISVAIQRCSQPPEPVELVGQLACVLNEQFAHLSWPSLSAAEVDEYLVLGREVGDDEFMLLATLPQPAQAMTVHFTSTYPVIAPTEWQVIANGPAGASESEVVLIPVSSPCGGNQDVVTPSTVYAHFGIHTGEVSGKGANEEWATFRTNGLVLGGGTVSVRFAGSESNFSLWSAPYNLSEVAPVVDLSTIPSIRTSDAMKVELMLGSSPNGTATPRLAGYYVQTESAPPVVPPAQIETPPTMTPGTQTPTPGQSAPPTTLGPTASTLPSSDTTTVPTPTSAPTPTSSAQSTPSTTLPTPVTSALTTPPGPSTSTTPSTGVGTTTSAPTSTSNTGATAQPTPTTSSAANGDELTPKERTLFRKLLAWFVRLFGLDTSTTED